MKKTLDKPMSLWYNFNMLANDKNSVSMFRCDSKRLSASQAYTETSLSKPSASEKVSGVFLFTISQADTQPCAVQRKPVKYFLLLPILTETANARQRVNNASKESVVKQFDQIAKWELKGLKSTL